MEDLSNSVPGATTPNRSRLAPPPSSALIAMQARGLELVSPPSSVSPSVGPYSVSAFSKSSDLDKPLPLEPHETVRRSSSIYTDASVETSITEIIQLYGGDEEVLSPSTSPLVIHQPKAYRDTIAPLLQHAYSFSRSLESLKIASHFIESQHAQASEEELRQGSPAASATYTKTAPTFQEFSRRLQDKRLEMISPLTNEQDITLDFVSPLSSDTELHRRQALNSLEPPTLRHSPETRVVQHRVSSTLPTSISGTIMNIDENAIVPAPLDLSRSTRYRTQAVIPLANTLPLTPREDLKFEEKIGSAADEKMLRHGSHDTRSTDSFVVYASAAEAVKAMIKEKLIRKKILKGKDSHDSKNLERRFSWRASQGASSEHGVTGIFRSLSTSNKHHEPTPRRQKQLAIQPTPYQRLGMAAYSPENKRKRHEERQRERARARAAAGYVEPEGAGANLGQRTSVLTRPGELVDAFHSGQSQLAVALDGARSLLGRKSSEKRREKLKQSITVLGPTSLPAGLAQEPKGDWL